MGAPSEIAERKRARVRELAQNPEINGQVIFDTIRNEFKTSIAKDEMYAIVREVRGLEKIERKPPVPRRKKRGPYKKRLTDQQIMMLTKTAPDVSPAIASLVSRLRDAMIEQNIAKIMISTASNSVQIARIVTEEVTL